MTKKLFVLAMLVVGLVFSASASYPVEAKNGNSNGSNSNGNSNGNSNKSSTSGYTLPPGIQHAPGIQKRLDSGKGLPPGIEKKVDGGGNGTTTPPTVDTTAPVLSGVGVTVSTSSATVAWQTDELSTGVLYHDDSLPVTTSDASASSSSLALNHQVILSGLTPNTTYYYMIVATDGSSNTSHTSALSFHTTALPAGDTTAPQLSNVQVAVATSSASITWQTDESTNGMIHYDVSLPVTMSDLSATSTASLALNHQVTLSGLTPDTTYYYFIMATDASGNVTHSSTLSFHTQSIPISDTAAPQIIFSTTANLRATSTSIIWVTNEASDSKLWLSTSTPVTTSGLPTASSTALVYYHSLDLNDLATSTQYYYTLGSTDSAGNTGFLTSGSFQTLAN